MAAVLATIDLDSRLGLRDEGVLLECRDRFVLLGSKAAVEEFGGGGQDFDNQDRIEHGVDLSVDEFRWTADHGDVRIRVQSALGDTYAEIADGDRAGAFL